MAASGVGISPLLSGMLHLVSVGNGIETVLSTASMTKIWVLLPLVSDVPVHIFILHGKVSS